MDQTWRLALLIALLGLVQGLLVVAAAAATACARKWTYFGAGVGWGILSLGLVLSDCLHMARGPGMLTQGAFPLYLAGLLAFPGAMARQQRPERRLRSWLMAQGILLVSLAPAMVAAVGGALCAMT